MDDAIMFGPLIENIIDRITSEIKKKKIRDKITKNLIDPILDDINNRYYPYMLMLTTLLIIIIVLLLMILLSNNNKLK